MSAWGIGGVGPINFEYHDESSFQSKNDKNSVSTTRVSPRIASFVWCCQERPLPQKCTQIAKLYSAAMDISVPWKENASSASYGDLKVYTRDRELCARCDVT
jgi:hypothetical protein